VRLCGGVCGGVCGMGLSQSFIFLNDWFIVFYENGGNEKCNFTLKTRIM